VPRQADETATRRNRSRCPWQTEEAAIVAVVALLVTVAQDRKGSRARRLVAAFLFLWMVALRFGLVFSEWALVQETASNGLFLGSNAMGSIWV
jgi:hypothetical protein